MRPFGTPLPVETSASSVVLPIGSRRYLRLAGIGTEQAMQIIASGEKSSTRQ